MARDRERARHLDRHPRRPGHRDGGPAVDAVAPGVRRPVHAPRRGPGCRAGPQQPAPGAGERSDRIWRALESLPTPNRNFILENLRLQQVYDLVYAEALDQTLRDTPIGKVRRWFPLKVLGEPDVFETGTGSERFRDLLQQLGPTYVKIGQMMASRGDILPPDLIAELSKLQSDAAPFPWEEASAGDPRGAGQAPGGAVRLHRPRAVRGRVHGPGPPRDPPRRDGRRGEGPAAPDRRQDEGGPGRDHPARGDRRAPRGHGAQGGRCRDGPRVRRRRPQGAGLPQRGVPREAPGGQHGPLPRDHRAPDLRRPVGHPRPHHGVHHRDQDLQGGRAPRGRVRHRRAGLRVHPRGHQADPHRRLLPRRPAPREPAGGSRGQAHGLPGHGPGRPAELHAAGQPARPHLCPQGGGHPGDRRRLHRARHARPAVRRGAVPQRRGPPRRASTWSTAG